MRHRIKGRKFGRATAHRSSMLANLAASLVVHEKITTTLPKAKDLRPYVEKLVTLARRGDLHAHRLLVSKIFGQPRPIESGDRSQCDQAANPQDQGGEDDPRAKLRNLQAVGECAE